MDIMTVLRLGTRRMEVGMALRLDIRRMDRMAPRLVILSTDRIEDLRWGRNANAVTFGATVGRDANSAQYGVASGYYADGSYYGAALGSRASASVYGVAIGRYANGAQTNTAIGCFANAQGGSERVARWS